MSSILSEKVSNKQTVNNVEFFLAQNRKGYNLYINNCTFVSPIYTFSLAGNISVYTPFQGTIREKYFNHIIYKAKKRRLRRGTNNSPSISSFTDRVFSIFRQKNVRV